MSEHNKDDDGDTDDRARTRIGADLIIPVAGLAFAGYYLWSIAGLPGMAQFSGRFLVAVLVVLVVLLALRMGTALTRGEAEFSFADLAETRKTALMRWGVFALAIGFALGIPYLGFTLSIFVFLLLSMLLLQVRPISRIFIIAFCAAAVGYLLFIVALGARLPRGPVETFLAGIF